MRYRTAESFRRALDDRLVVLARESGLPIDRLRKYAAFERFLARVEAVSPMTWVLKGGLAINCRLGTFARPSRDIDLAHGAAEGAIGQLAAVAEAVSSPDDHFRFRPSLEPAASTHREESQLRLRLATSVAGRVYDLATVDVVVEPDLAATAEVLEVPSVLGFADLSPVTMLVTPVERHIADKVDAYLRGHINVRTVSTREKDLVDIVLLAAAERPHAGRLRRALHDVLHTEHAVPAALPPPPAAWGAAYRSLAQQLGLEERTVAMAFERARALLDPVLDGSASDDARWEPASRTWR
jgi:hypothetical protein